MIDIIIPVYNGYDETKACIQSLLNTKNNIKHRLIFINDKSPDIKIVEMLNSIGDNRVLVLENEKNSGFVKTVNRGMQLSKNDVILLNSDTVVTDFWIDKMNQAAYSNSKVATVTSLTNNGTIASVPFFNQDNELPKGHSIQKFATLVESISNKVYPVIPTAVGHALFIKRSIIEKIGYFDEKNFGKGYCEENDYSARVIKAGYLNILADDTFIFHFGSTSFKEEKAKRIAENKKKLFLKHPFYPFAVKRFLYFDKKVRKICSNIQRELEI